MPNTNSITYRLVTNYFFRTSSYPYKETNITFSKWEMMHKDYILKHKKFVFTTLLVEEKLWQHLADIDTQAQQMFDTLVEQMKNIDGVTEQVKEDNQIELVCRIREIEASVREFINNMIIYN